MNTVRSLVSYNGRLCLTAQDSFNDVDGNPLLPENAADFVNNLSAADFERLMVLVDLAVSHLNVLCKSFGASTCYNEATGRQCYASTFVGSPCKAEAALPLEISEEDGYIGSG